MSYEGQTGILMKKLLLIAILSSGFGFVGLNGMDYNFSKNREQLDNIIEKAHYTCEKGFTKSSVEYTECVKNYLLEEAKKKRDKAAVLRERLNSSGKLSEGNQLKADDYEKMANALVGYAINL